MSVEKGKVVEDNIRKECDREQEDGRASAIPRELAEKMKDVDMINS